MQFRRHLENWHSDRGRGARRGGLSHRNYYPPPGPDGPFPSRERIVSAIVLLTSHRTSKRCGRPPEKSSSPPCSSSTKCRLSWSTTRPSFEIHLAIRRSLPLRTIIQASVAPTGKPLSNTARTKLRTSVSMPFPRKTQQTSEILKQTRRPSSPGTPTEKKEPLQPRCSQWLDTSDFSRIDRDPSKRRTLADPRPLGCRAQ